MKITSSITMLLLAAGGSAYGQLTQTFTGNFNITNPGQQTVNLSLFDTMGGTRILDSVTLLGTGTTQADVTITNTDTQARTITASLGGYVQISTSGVTPGLSGNSFLSYNSSAQLLNPNQTIDFGLQSSSFNTSATASSNLLSFEGTGTFGATLNSQGNWSAGGVSNSQVTISKDSSYGTVEVEYTYHTVPVPEPSTLFMGGLVGIGMALRRRRRA